MTEQTTRLRRFDDLRMRTFALCVLLPASLAAAGVAGGATTPMPKVPILQTVGVLPAQWEGTTDLPAKAQIAAAFPSAVRASHKFRVLNDELVEGLWQTPDGRNELKSDYELQAFVGLTTSLRSDTATFTARLTDGALKSYLLETDVVALDWLANASPADIQERLEGLVFRLVNRLPVDVSVTSVQGAYITLSGGSEQNIEVGDKVDVVRAVIRSLHPANGTWLDFKKLPLGSAQIVEVKSANSVAKILSQTYERAIEVGDGARIGALASRIKFARLAANEGLKDSGNQDTIIVTPLYTEPQPTKVAKAAPKEAAAPATEGSVEAPVTEPTATPHEEAPPPPAAVDQPPPPEEVETTILDDVVTEATKHKPFDEINAYAGPYLWSMKGGNLPGASGKFPWYLVNSVGGGVTHTLLFKIKTAFGGGLLFGKTADASYVGYQGYARIYWEESLQIGNGLLSGWRAGGHGSISGMAIDRGAYGGGDWIRGGGFGALFGKFAAGDRGERYNWYGEFALMPLTIGRGGYRGSRQQVQSSFGTIIGLGAVQDRPVHVIAWGGGIEISNEVQTLQDGRRPQYQSFQLKALARYEL